MRKLNYQRKWDKIKSELKYRPIIATGRGGSGTRLLSKLLQTLNIFLGNQLNVMEDSVEWVDLLYKIGIERTRPQPSRTFTHWRFPLQETAADILTTGNWDGHQPWGWKLPETMLVLPEIFDAFNQAKLIQIIRHPVDTSLRRTHISSSVNNIVGKSVLQAAYGRLGWNQDRIANDPDYLRNAASWFYQVDEVARFGREELDPDRYHEIRYEDLCTNPMNELDSLSKFLKIQMPERPRQNELFKMEIDPLRRRSWNPPDVRADEVWEICGQTARKLGYKSILE